MNHDSHEKIFPADPRITAYAFGELEGDELKLIEAAVKADAALQAAVAELCAFSGDLSTALAKEPADATAAGAIRAPAPKKRPGWLISFPIHYLATAAAACFAVVLWMRQEPRATPSAEKPTANVAIAEVAPAVAEMSLDHAVAAPPSEPGYKTMSFEQFKLGQTLAEKPAAPAFDDKRDKRSDLSVTLNVQAKPVHVLRGSAALSESDQSTGVVGNMAFAASQPAPAAPVPARAFAYSNQDADGAALATVANESRARRSRDYSKQVGEVSQSWSRPAALTAPGYFGEPAPNAEVYATQVENGYRTVADEPLSTFSVDVDTASYSNVRRFLTSGLLPPRDAVRVEELINYFPYRYAPPAPAGAKDAVPFAAKLEVASAPWAPAHRLVRIGLKGREFNAAARPAANLVFLIDVSGSMNSANKLPLVKESLRLLVDRLRPDDRVAIVTYAGSSGLALPSTKASQKREILAALDNLNASGSTNGAIGIHLAYDIAKANFVAGGGINRVILCTDGDFNVGVTDRGQLVSLIEEKAKSRVFLSVFGFGMGNLKDNTLESLSAKGNGSYGYIDSRREAEKVFVEQVEGTLATIAKDVKVQVEFNPARVQSYRLIGYENRMLAKEDFNNDAVDAGDIGAGHTVTALYEIVPVGVDADGVARPPVDALKYQPAPAGKRKSKPVSVEQGSGELLTVKIRYKQPEGDVSAKQEFPLVDRGAEFAKADGEFQFAAAVAAWGMVLRDSPHKGSATFEQVLAWAENGLGDDAAGHRAEFIQLVRRSAELSK
ncbi:MAG: VWA domain-containing protein [Rariglobus sp.]